MSISFRLTREIDTVQLLSGAYIDAAAPWLENWQETRRAIAHNDSSVIEYSRRQGAGRGAVLAA